VAVILSAIDRHWPDFGIIPASASGQRRGRLLGRTPAGNAIAALKATLAIKARVKRDGKWINPAARELVRATLFACGLATLCRRMRACWTATRSRWISPP